MKVHELLDAPEKWIQRSYAADDNGHSTNPSAVNAVCWCFEGAMMRCYPTGFQDVLDRVEERIGNDLPFWNDNPSRTFNQVRALALELDI